jgi:hypothetical protein
MPEARQIAFSFQELAEVLVRQQEIHEGLWGIYTQFGIAAANVNGPEGGIVPAAIIPVQGIGIQRFDVEVEGLTVDAATVNPAPSPETA